MTKEELRAHPKYQELCDAYKVILNHLRSNTTDKTELLNFEGSEDRCARALLETCHSESDIKQKVGSIIDRVFAVEQADTVKNVNAQNSNGIVCQGPIRVNSCCPHHLYQVMYEVYVAYIPKEGRVLGLSKLARLAKELGRRPILHEELASDLADVLCAPMCETIEQDQIDYGTPKLKRMDYKFPALESNGSAVLVVGVHTCLACRGVEADARTAVCELRGAFNNPEMEQKFYSLIKSNRTANIG